MLSPVLPWPSRRASLRFRSTNRRCGTRLPWSRRWPRAAGRPLRLTLTENRSVLLSFRRQRALTLVRLHRMFLHAPPAVVEAVARSLRRTRRRAEADVRRFMNENLHRVRKVKRALPPLVTEGQAHDLQQVFDATERALLRQRAQGAAHLGQGRRTRAARRADLRQLRPGAGAHPHPSRAGPAATCPTTSWRASSTTRCSTTTWAACPTRRAAPSTTRARSARRRRATPSTRRRWPGRRRTCRCCCGPARSSTRSDARAAPLNRSAGPSYLTSSLMRHLRRLLPYLARHRGALLRGTACLLLTTALSVASPWVLRHAVDDLVVAVTRAKLALYASLTVGLVAVEGVFRYFMRTILIGVSREVEYELRNDLFAHLTRLDARYYQRHRDRRPDEPRHERPVGGAHGARTRHHVHGQHGGHLRGHGRAHGAHQPAAAAPVAAAAGPGVRAGALLRAAHPRPLRGRAGAALDHDRPGAGEPVRRAGGARLRAGDGRARRASRR